MHRDQLPIAPPSVLDMAFYRRDRPLRVRTVTEIEKTARRNARWSRLWAAIKRWRR